MEQFKEGCVVLPIDTYTQLLEIKREMEALVGVRICSWDTKNLEAVINAAPLINIVNRTAPAQLKQAYEIYEPEQMYNATTVIGTLKKPADESEALDGGITLGDKDDGTCKRCGVVLEATEQNHCTKCAEELAHNQETDPLNLLGRN